MLIFHQWCFPKHSVDLQLSSSLRVYLPVIALIHLDKSMREHGSPFYSIGFLEDENFVLPLRMRACVCIE